ncbi:Nesprin-1 [Manis pentadactyla]|nr:Nesprin-1 [Manis pentadactyla]
MAFLPEIGVGYLGCRNDAVGKVFVRHTGNPVKLCQAKGNQLGPSAAPRPQPPASLKARSVCTSMAHLRHTRLVAS